MRKKLNLFFKAIIIVIFISACAPTKTVIKTTTSRSLIPNIKILLTTSHFLQIKITGKFILRAPEAKYKISEVMGSLWAVYDAGLLSLSSTKRKWHFQSGFPIIIEPINNKSFFTIEGKELKGALLIYSGSENQISYILQTDLENYLLGVVPSEIPTGNIDYYNAIQAQTIAARTYAYKKYLDTKNEIYNLYDDQRDQVLGTMTKTNEIATKAIKKTRGIILHSAENNFIPYYHSTCGGVYMSYSDSGYTKIAYDAPNKDSIAYCSISPYYRWFKKFNSQKVIINLIRKKIFTDTTKFNFFPHQLSFSINNRLTNGYVSKLGIKVDSSQFKLRNYAIRTTMIDSSNKALPSNWFFISPTTTDSLSVLFVGAGYGHGKGMCQWGAIAMSMKGFNFKQILKHYYPAAAFKRIYR